MDTQAIINQLSNAVVALIIIVLGGFGTFAVAWFKLLPDRMKAQQQEYQANQAVERQKALNEIALAVEKAKNENIMDAAVSNVAQDLTRVFLAQVPIFQTIGDEMKSSRGDQAAMKDDITSINKALAPLPTMAEQIEAIYKMLEDIKNEPRIPGDKLKQIDDAIEAMNGFMLEFSRYVADAKAELMKEKEHISKPIPTIDRPNGKEQ